MTGYERQMYADISRISESLKQIRDSLKVIADAVGENATRPDDALTREELGES